MTLGMTVQVKSVKNVNNPSRKVYMAFELEPSRELTGGAWCVVVVAGVRGLVAGEEGERAQRQDHDSSHP